MKLSLKKIMLLVAVLVVLVLAFTPVYSKSFEGCGERTLARGSMLLGADKNTIDSAVADHIKRDQARDCNPKNITYRLYVL